MNKVKNATICGAGRMGTVIGYAMRHLGYNVSAVDNCSDNIANFVKVNGGCPVYTNWKDVIDKPDVVVSALPYHATTECAKWAMESGLRYCDLGGSVPTSEGIKELALQNKSGFPVMTDLGLAPGWINLMAEELYSLLPGASRVKMMVGGIPRQKVESDPLNYMITWSIDGLLNEYQDHCELLLENEVHFVNGMAMCEDVDIDGMELEAFCTSGASAHSIPVMKQRGVHECVYKTLRWRGHRNWMSFLMRTLDRPSLEKVLQESSKCHDSDMVVMHVVVERGSTKLTKTNVITASYQFTAMQRSTAFAISAVADIMASGEFDGMQYPSYADVPIADFNKNLALLMDGTS